MAKAAASDCHVKFDVLRCARRCFVILIRKSRIGAFDSVVECWPLAAWFSSRVYAVELPQRAHAFNNIIIKSSREKSYQEAPLCHCREG